MSDSELIWKYLVRSYPNDHQVVYIFVCGQKRSENTAIKQIIGFITPIFAPSISKDIIFNTILDFLNHKKKDYLDGKIRVKSLY